MRKGIADRGDVLHLDLEPAMVREQRGKRYVMVLSTAELNRFGVAMVCPITQGGGFARERELAVSLSGVASVAQGLVLCHQARTVDYRERGARWIESLPEDVVEEVLARVRALLD